MWTRRCALYLRLVDGQTVASEDGVMTLRKLTKGLVSAGLNAIAREYQEAAVVDGADRGRRFWSITWPLLRPPTFYVLVL